MFSILRIRGNEDLNYEVRGTGRTFLNVDGQGWKNPRAHHLFLQMILVI